MTWQEPKTDWTSADGVTDADLNRIEGNTEEVKTDLDNHKSDTANPHNVTAAQLGGSSILAQLKTVDGSGSGLDADLLDGKQTSSIGNRWDVVPFIGFDGVMEVGKYIDFHESDTDTSDYSVRVFSESGILYINGNKIWHKGNDGSGSGLDADLLDGWHRDSIRNWNNILNKPATFTPSAHQHAGGDITSAVANAVNVTGEVKSSAKIYGKVGEWELFKDVGEPISQFASPGTSPQGLAWDGTYLWNADNDTDQIYKLNTTGTIISQFASPGTSPQGLAWDGTYLWNADNGADQIYKLNTTGTIISQFASPYAYPQGLAWDGTYLWNADNDTDQIYKLNTTGTIISQFASPGTSPQGLAWDGTYLWNADNSADRIYKLDTTGTYHLVVKKQ
jgi:hypothetical protein